MLTYLSRGILAEILKLKRSLVLILTLVIPLFPSFANIADYLQSGSQPPLDGMVDPTPWSLYFHFSFELWTIFALPMVVAILSALLAYTDHHPKTWKVLFALSFPRAAIFTGKWVALAGLLLLSNLVFTLANLAGGVLIHFARPDYGLNFPIPVWDAFSRVLVSWLLSLLIVSIHLWISLRWSSFLVSLTVGFAATVSNLFLIASYMSNRVALSPWAMPVQVYGNWQGSLPVALIGALLVSLLAGQGFVNRDVL